MPLLESDPMSSRAIDRNPALEEDSRAQLCPLSAVTQELHWHGFSGLPLNFSSVVPASTLQT